MRERKTLGSLGRLHKSSRNRSRARFEAEPQFDTGAIRREVPNGRRIRPEQTEARELPHPDSTARGVGTLETFPTVSTDPRTRVANSEGLILDVELCHYNGEIRDVPGSWVALSTCNGIRGILYDGSELLYVERASRFNSSNPLNDLHVVYKHSDLKSNFTCGFHDHSSHATTHHSATTVGNRRVRRNTDAVHGPYNSNKLSRYIELVLVSDMSLYKAFNDDVHRVHRHAKDLANIINSLYAPLNIFVALVGVVIWTKHDEIVLDKNGDKTLNHFLVYRKNKLTGELHNDNAQFLT
ncbi:hypothetical protein ACP70R_050174 [Stipagrostis hirtigluma subsp. patula]